MQKLVLNLQHVVQHWYMHSTKGVRESSVGVQSTIRTEKALGDRRAHNSKGTLPVILFPWSHARRNFLRKPISVGMVPCKRLFRTEYDDSAVISPILVLMVPMIFISCTCNLDNCTIP
jgi:hypothetical protein